MTVSLLTIITIIAGALSLYDGIVRLRGKRGSSILAIVEIIAAALLLLSLFGILVTSISIGVLAVVLVIVLILQLVMRGSTRTRGGSTITIIALIASIIVVIVAFGLLAVPGLNA